MAAEPHYIDVDLKKKTQFQLPTVTQNDTDTVFILRVSDDGRSDNDILDAFSTVTLTSERRDRQAFYVAGSKVDGTNEVEFHLGTKELELTGRVTASVQFYSVDGRNSSAHFHYNVEKDLASEYEPTETEVTLIETVLVEGPQRIAETIAATEDAIEATAFADQTRLLTEEERMATELVRLSTVEAKNAAEDAAALANTSAENADAMTEAVVEVTVLAVAEVEAARIQKEEVQEILSAGPVASVNGQTGIVSGLALQSDVDEVTLKLAEKARREEVRLKSVKVEPEDWSERALALATGQGTINLETIPQENSVTYERLYNGLDGLLERSKNLLNKDDPDFKINFILTGGGNLSASEGKQVTGFIKVNPGDKIQFNVTGNTSANIYRISTFNTSKTLVKGDAAVYVKEFLVPAGVSYVRICSEFLLNEKAQIEIGEAPTYWVPFGYNLKTAEIITEKFTGKIEEDSVSYKALSGNLFTPSRNLLNLADPDFLTGYQLNSIGTTTASANYQISGYIEAKPGDVIRLSIDSAPTFPHMYRVSTYDGNKTHVVSSGVNAGSSYTVPAGVSYVRVSSTLLLTNKAQIEKGDKFTKFVPYGINLNVTEVNGFSVSGELPENSVSPIAISRDMVRVGKNRLNKNDPDFIPTGASLNSSGYVSLNTGTGAVSGWIEAEPNQSVWFRLNEVSKSARFAAYDSNKVFISFADRINAPFVTPANTAFIRVGSSSLTESEAQIEFSSRMTAFEPYGYDVRALNFIGKVNGTQNLPQYQQDEIERVETEVLNATEVLKFGFVTDTHVFNDSQAHAKLQQVAELDQLGYLDAIIHGGDVIEGEETKEEAIRILKDATKTLKKSKTDVMIVKGNHDTNPTAYDEKGDDVVLPNNVWHNITCNHLHGKVVFDEANPFGGYFYKDYERSKVRMIFMNTSDVIDDSGHALANPINPDIRQKQFEWFTSKALDFMEKGTDRENWAVVIISHASLFTGAYSINYGGVYTETVIQNTHNFNGVIKAFTTGGSFSLTTNAGNDFQLVSDVNFSEQGAMELICGINGHAHFDTVSTIGETGRPQIYVANMQTRIKGKGAGAGGTDLYPTIGALDEIVVPYRGEIVNAGDGLIHSELMDVFMIDREQRTIRTIRYGAGSDRLISY